MLIFNIYRMSSKYLSSTKYLFVNTEDLDGSPDQINNIQLNLGGSCFESDDDSLIKLSLTQFNMAKNWYDINDTNNAVRILQKGFTHSSVVVDDTDVIIKLPPGDYICNRQIQQAFCEQLKIALDAKVNASGDSMTYTVAPNGDETKDYGIKRGSDGSLSPIITSGINTRLFGVLVTASVGGFRYTNPIHIHSLHISPTQGLNGGLTADEQFNDSAMLLGGNRCKVYHDLSSDSDVLMASNNCFSVSSATNVTSILGYYPMNTSTHTLPYVYLRVNTVVNSTTSNFENVSHNHTTQVVPSHVLAKIQRVHDTDDPGRGVYYRMNDEAFYMNYITQNRLNDLQFSLTDSKGRVLPQNNLGSNMGVFSQSYTASSKKINVNGNLFCDFTLKLERVPVPFAPNILQGFPDPSRQPNNAIHSNISNNGCLL